MQCFVKVLFTLALSCPLATALAAPSRDAFPGIERITTKQSVNEIEARLRQALESRGLTLFAVIDHSQGAADAGLELQPMSTVIFGNPEAGTPWLQCQGSAALDLPQKMVIRQEGYATRIEWNDPAYLAERHDLHHCDLPLEKTTNLLQTLAREAAGGG